MSLRGPLGWKPLARSADGDLPLAASRFPDGKLEATLRKVDPSGVDNVDTLICFCCLNGVFARLGKFDFLIGCICI